MASKQRIPSPLDTITGGFNAFDDLADTIANPDPSRPLRNAVGSAGRAYCNAIGSAPGLYGDVIRNVQGIPSLLCKPYWDRNAWTPPQPAGGFRGGQCSALYTVNLDIPDFRFRRVVCSTGVVEFEGNPQNQGLANVQGPIQRIFPKVTGTGSCGPNGYVLAIIDANGTERLGGTLATATSTRRIEIIKFEPKVVRSDGSPDNCGDKPGPLEPGPNPPPPTTFPPGEEPGIDPDGQPFFFVPPVPPVIPGIDIPDGPVIGPPPGGGGGGNPPGPAEPGTPGEGTEPEGEAPPGEEIYAIVVEFLTVPAYAREIEPGLYVSPCRVFLGTSFGLDLDEAGRAMRSGQAVFAEIDGLTKWRVSASVGFTIRVTPYYREKAT